MLYKISKDYCLTCVENVKTEVNSLLESETKIDRGIVNLNAEFRDLNAKSSDNLDRVKAGMCAYSEQSFKDDLLGEIYSSSFNMLTNIYMSIDKSNSEFSDLRSTADNKQRVLGDLTKNFIDNFDKFKELFTLYVEIEPYRRSFEPTKEEAFFNFELIKKNLFDRLAVCFTGLKKFIEEKKRISIY